MSKRRLNSEEIIHILENISSDPEEDNDTDDDSEEDVCSTEVLAEDSDCGSKEKTKEQSRRIIISESDNENENNEMILNDEDYFSSDDEVPLSSFIAKNWGQTYNISSCPPFQEYVGVLGEVKVRGDEMSPFDMFSLLLGEDMLDKITFQTNLYATQFRQCN